MIVCVWCLQETWLSKQQEEELKCMRVDCNTVSSSPNDDYLCFCPAFRDIYPYIFITWPQLV